MNLQQLPKAGDEDKYQIRSLFIGSIDSETDERNKIITFDYNNLEMRVLAHWSKDSNLINMFLNGEDAHGSTAVNMFELDCDASEVKKKYPHLRQSAKILNFLLAYGGSSFALYNSLKDDHYAPIDLGQKQYLEQYKCKDGKEVAQVYIDKYFTSYSGVASFMKSQKRFAHKYGYVTTLLGRKRRLPMIHSDNFKDVGYAERLSTNSCIQGSAADIMMSAQNLIHNDERLKELKVKMIIQIHDEACFECPESSIEEAVPIIQHHMSNMFKEKTSQLNLPFEAEYGVGDSYFEAK